MQNIAEFHIIGRIGKIDSAKEGTHLSIAANYNRRDGDEWKTDTRTKAALHFDISLSVYDERGKLLAKQSLKGRDNIGGKRFGTEAYVSEQAPQAFANKLEALFKTPDVMKALGGKHALYVVGYQQQRLLLACSPAGVSLVSHLPADDSTPVPSQAVGGENFMQALQHAVQAKAG